MKRRRQFHNSDLETWRRVQSTVKPMPKKRGLKERCAEFDEWVSDENNTPEAPKTKRKNYASLQSHKQIAEPRPIQSRADLAQKEPQSDIGGLARSTRRAIRKGSLEPSAKADLHGLRHEAARARLLSFLTQSARDNHRMVLVVTGKGGHRRDGAFGAEVTGVIRRSFPEWLRAPDIAPFVSHFTPAHIRHGGDGAWYVFIRSSARRG